MRTVHVHFQRPSPRAEHAVRLVLEDMLGWNVLIIPDEAIFAALKGPRLVYGARAVGGAFHLVSDGFLEQNGIGPLAPTVLELEGMPILFPVKGGQLAWDVLAASFFLLSRYEEWSALPLDEHGRPLTNAMHAARHGYMHRPIVDEWALHLARAWRAFDPTVPLPVRRYRQVVTIDLDNGFKYLGRPLWRSVGSWIRDALNGRWTAVAERMQVLRGKVSDPYDIYSEIRQHLVPAADRVIFFVLAAPRGTRDHCVPATHAGYACRLRSLSDWAEVGVHPSYFSGDGPGTTARELALLKQVLGLPVRLSRQHFLRMRIPATLRVAEELGIVEEHSMGCHDHAGFRAGTCTPYRWYDLAEERSTMLLIHPFVVMDNTLRNKLDLRPEEAVAHVMPLIDAVRRVDGTFTGLWHESFLGSDAANAGWRSAILSIIEAARP